MVAVQTVRFGIIEVDEASIIRIPRGLFGFEDAQEFALIQHRPDAPFRWLQCLTVPELAFVVIDPSKFFADYEFELSTIEAEYLEIFRPEDALVLSIVSIGAGSGSVTANLVGPVVINARSLVGMQIVLDAQNYGTRHPLVSNSNSSDMEALVQAA